jgi:hypothetical protein
MKATVTILILAAASLAYGESPAENESRAALALAKAQRERQSINVSASADKCFENQADAERVAKALNRPVIYWVGMCCVDSPEVRKQLPDVVHCHLKELNGSSMARVVFTSSDGLQQSLEKDSIVNCAECSASVIRKLSGLPVKK